MTIPALFLFAHPDDELLAASVALAEHLAVPGAVVHVAWASRGTASGVVAQLNGTADAPWWGYRHDPTAEGYQPLTPHTLGVARMAEAHAAMRVLSAGLPGALHLHCLDLPDGQVTPALAADALAGLVDEIAPTGTIRIKTHSHIVDDHADHRAVGAAARSLRAIDPGRIEPLRHYVLPPYRQDARLGQVAESWDTPATPEIAARVRNAARQYACWMPEVGRIAAGYHSVAGMFDTLAAQPRSMVHG